MYKFFAKLFDNHHSSVDISADKENLPIKINCLRRNDDNNNSPSTKFEFYSGGEILRKESNLEYREVLNNNVKRSAVDKKTTCVSKNLKKKAKHQGERLIDDGDLTNGSTDDEVKYIDFPSTIGNTHGQVTVTVLNGSDGPTKEATNFNWAVSTKSFYSNKIQGDNNNIDPTLQFAKIDMYSRIDGTPFEKNFVEKDFQRFMTDKIDVAQTSDTLRRDKIARKIKIDKSNDIIATFQVDGKSTPVDESESTEHTQTTNYVYAGELSGG